MVSNGSSQDLPTCYLHFLAACPNFGPSELGPDTPTPPGTDTRPCPPRSLVPARTQLTQSYRLGQPGELTFPFHSRHSGGSCLPPTTFSLPTSCHTPLLPTSAHGHGRILLFGTHYCHHALSCCCKAAAQCGQIRCAEQPDPLCAQPLGPRLLGDPG